jgi:hypothetical protein
MDCGNCEARQMKEKSETHRDKEEQKHTTEGTKNTEKEKNSFQVFKTWKLSKPPDNVNLDKVSFIISPGTFFGPRCFRTR